MKVGQLDAACDEHEAADYLNEELGTVAHSYQVVGYAYEIHHDDGTAGISQWQCFRDDLPEELIVPHRDVDGYKQDEGEEDDGREGNAA